MATGRLMEEVHFVHVGTSSNIASYADFTTTNPATDIVSMKNYQRCTFVVIYGAGAVGTSTITVEACATASGTTQAIAFNYRACTTPDTWGEVTACDSAGFTTAANADKMYLIEVNAAELYSTYSFVRLQFTEVDSTAVDGTVIAILSQPRYIQGIPVGALA
jgi:hypothetical protein